MLKQWGIFPKPGFWKHKTKQIQFVLVVDNFGIKYLKKEDLEHLIHLLEKFYDIAIDLDRKEFVKIELDWNYENKQVHFLWRLTFSKLCDNSTA